MCQASFTVDDAPHSVPSRHGSGMCQTGSPSNDAIRAEMDHKDSCVGDEAQSKRRKCPLLDELDIIPELTEWSESAFDSFSILREQNSKD